MIKVRLSGTRDSLFLTLVWTGCPLGKWGRDCEMDCKCQNGATCDPFDGNCMCTRGWTGVYCDQKCLPNRYGQDCAEECRCRNGGSCHHISGECHCASGYTGPLWVPNFVDYHCRWHLSENLVYITARKYLSAFIYTFFKKVFPEEFCFKNNNSETKMYLTRLVSIIDDRYCVVQMRRFVSDGQAWPGMQIGVSLSERWILQSHDWRMLLHVWLDGMRNFTRSNTKRIPRILHLQM